MAVDGRCLETAAKRAEEVKKKVEYILDEPMGKFDEVYDELKRIFENFKSMGYADNTLLKIECYRAMGIGVQ